MLHECRSLVPLRHLQLMFNRSSLEVRPQHVPKLMEKCTGQRVPKLDAQLPHGKHLQNALILRVLLLLDSNLCFVSSTLTATS